VKERDNHQTQVETLENQVETLTGFKTKIEQAETTLRNDIKGKINAVEGEGGADIFDAALSNMSFDQLCQERKKWETRFDQKVPLACKKCGSTEVDRRSSLEAPLETPGGGSPEPKLQKIEY
jgi:hypothetical protein